MRHFQYRRRLFAQVRAESTASVRRGAPQRRPDYNEEHAEKSIDCGLWFATATFRQTPLNFRFTSEIRLPAKLSRRTTEIMVEAWTFSSSNSSTDRREDRVGTNDMASGCSRDKRYHGLEIDVFVLVLTLLSFWACMIVPIKVTNRGMVRFGHGCSGNRMHLGITVN